MAAAGDKVGTGGEDRGRERFEPRGPRPPDPPPEEPSPPTSGGPPLLRVLFYLGSVFLLLNFASLLALTLYGLATRGPDSIREFIEEAAARPGAELLIVLYAVSAPLAWAWTWLFRCRFERRGFRSLGFRGPGALPRTAAGWALGIALSGAVLGLGSVLGVYEVRLPESAVPWGTIGWLLGGFLLQSATEELIVRGYAQKNLVEWRADARSPGWVLVLPSLVFAIAHISNPENGAIPFVNTFLLGFALGAAVLSSGRLFGAIGFHAGWNFGLACLWSLPVSGMSAPGWLVVTRRPEAAEWADRLFGGAYGPEGGLVVTLLVVLGISVLLPRAMDQWFRDRWRAHDLR